jgi:hypothetical protein
VDEREFYAEDVAGVLQLEELDRNDGAMRDRGGRLLATVAQEHLLIHTQPPTAPASEG